MSYNNIERDEITKFDIKQSSLSNEIDHLILDTQHLSTYNELEFNSKFSNVTIKKVVDMRSDQHVIIIRAEIDQFTVNNYANLDDNIAKAEAELERLRALKL